MDSMWPENFAADIDIKPAKDIVDAQSKHLEKLTNSIVYVNSYRGESPSIVSPTDPHGGNKFLYHMDIRGKMLDDYYFRLISYSHDIALYPCIITIEDSVASDIGSTKKYIARSEEDFIIHMRKILKSERLRMIIGSIMKLSSAKDMF